jgi:hypothetical protein
MPEAVAEAGAQAAIRADLLEVNYRWRGKGRCLTKKHLNVFITADAKDAMPDDESKNSLCPDEEEIVGTETTHNLMK